MKLRRLSLAAAAAALALTAAVGSASAATPATLNVVHGIPGVAVDVCVGGSTVKANFKYGQQFRAQLPAGSYVLKVRAHTAIPCKGTQLIQRSVTLTDGLNATVVANVAKGTPGLSVWGIDLSGTAADKATLTVIHAATAPTVDVWLNGGSAPAVPGLARISKAGPVAVDAGVYSWWVSATGDYKPVIGPAVAKLAGGHAYQVIAVGTKVSNFRFVVVDQAGA